jgi:MFS superfamily sulfate permease-like transporter
VMPRSDAVVLVVTFALTVIFDLVVAVELGMVLAAILFIKRVSETTEVSRVTGDDVLESPEQLAQGKRRRIHPRLQSASSAHGVFRSRHTRFGGC